MKTKIIYLAGLIAISLPTAMQAKPGNAPGTQGRGPEALLERLDSDQNGSLSRDEFVGRLAERFESIDADGDGVLTADELTAARKQARDGVKNKAGKIKDADTDKSRTISIDEASAANMQRLVKRFDVIDADGDGEISRQEMRDFRKAAKSRKNSPN